MDGPLTPRPPLPQSGRRENGRTWTRRGLFVGKLLVSVGLLAWIIQRASLSEVLELSGLSPEHREAYREVVRVNLESL